MWQVSKRDRPPRGAALSSSHEARRIAAGVHGDKKLSPPHPSGKFAGSFPDEANAASSPPSLRQHGALRVHPKSKH